MAKSKTVFQRLGEKERKRQDAAFQRRFDIAMTAFRKQLAEQQEKDELAKAEASPEETITDDTKIIE